MIDEGLLRRLRGLIGRECTFLGQRCRIIEVLTDQDRLVLEVHETVPPIQTDQYGQAVWRGLELVELPLCGQTPDQPSEELLDLLASLPGEGTAARAPER